MVNKYKFLFLVPLIVLFSCATKQIDDFVLLQVDFNDALAHYNSKKYSVARDEFMSVIYNDPLSEHANYSQFYVAECEYNLKNYKQAISEYLKYLRTPFQRVPFVNKSELILCRCYYKLSLDFNKDQSGTYLAIEKLQYYLEKENLNEHSLEIEGMIKSLRNKLAKKDYETANLYIRLKEYEAAEMYFSNIVNEFYDSEYFDSAVFNISLLKSFSNKDEGILFLENNRNDFRSEQKYLNAINVLENLNKDEKIEYYLKLLK